MPSAPQVGGWSPALAGLLADCWMALCAWERRTHKASVKWIEAVGAQMEEAIVSRGMAEEETRVTKSAANKLAVSGEHGSR